MALWGVFFAEISGDIWKSWSNFCWDFELGAVQRIANLVDLEKCCKMSIWTQKSASIQPRTDRRKWSSSAARPGGGAPPRIWAKTFQSKCQATNCRCSRSGLKGSIAEGPNHSNFSAQNSVHNSVRIWGKFVRIHQKLWNLKDVDHFLKYFAKINADKFSSRSVENAMKIIEK